MSLNVLINYLNNINCNYVIMFYYYHNHNNLFERMKILNNKFEI